MRPAAKLSVLLVSTLAWACTGGAPAAIPEPSPTPVAVTGAPQYRALWVDAFHDGFKSPAQVDRLVADAERARLNALFVQVRKRGDAYFNRSVEPRAADIAAPASFDPLDYLISKAHSARPPLQVHAWVNTFYVGTSSRVYSEHGSDWANRTEAGDSGGFLDPGVPEVARYTHDVFVSLVRAYPLDGLHLDFVRYPAQEWGYAKISVDRFNASIGSPGASPPPAQDPAWSQWRRDQVTEFVRSIYTDAGTARPGLKLSAALIAYGEGPRDDAAWTRSAPYRDVFQDWRSWLETGILDLGVAMNYDSDWNRQQAGWFDLWIRFEKDHQYERRVLIGMACFLNYPENSFAQLRRAMSPTAAGNTAAGVALYSYASTSPYGTDDYYTDPDLAAGLPRQPYGSSLGDKQLAARARLYNDFFWTMVSQPATYWDPALQHDIDTTPVFTDYAPVSPPGPKR